MTEFLGAIPWVALLVVFIGMALLQLRTITALDHALTRSQDVPAPPIVIPPPPVVTRSPAPIGSGGLVAGIGPPPVPKPSGPFAGAPPWFAWAMHEVGTVEGPNNTGPELERYAQLAHCGSQGDPWCA